MEDDTTHLKRELRLWDVFSIAAGAMISSGLFVLPGLAFEKVGPMMVVCYMLAGLFYIPVMFAQAELASAMPKSGGSYFFVERSFGGLMGTIAGLGNWLSLALKAAFACIGIGTFIQLISPEAPEWQLKALAVAAVLFFTTLNTVSVKGTGKLQRYLVLSLFGILFIYVAAGLLVVQPDRFRPFLAENADIFTVFTVTGMVFISYGGLTKVVDVAGEVYQAQRNIPLGIFLAFGMVNLLYAAVTFVTVGVMERETLRVSLMPIAEGGANIMGPLGLYAISAAAFMAYATTGNAGILSASRSPMAMGQDGLLPHRLSRTGRRFSTPHVSIGLTGIVIILFITLLSLENLVKAASAMLLLSFIMINLSLVVMRHSGIEGYRPTFRTPLYPYLPLASVLLYLFLVLRLGTVPLLLALGLVTLAALWYLVFVQRHIERQPAVVAMMRKLLEKHAKRTGLDEEILQITLERDEVLLDRFDHLIKDCPVLDIKKPLSADQLFKLLAETLAERTDLSEETLYQGFLEREQAASTVIQPGLAIPHAMIEGTDLFEVAVLRCKDGISFPDEDTPVNAVFALVGSRNERQFHLQALMAVANVVCEPEFEKRWNNARSIDQIRDVVLLSQRKRIK